MIYPIAIKGKTKKQITKLNLSGLNLGSFPENIIEYPNLTKLVLSNNKIKAIPGYILKLKKLKVLDLANNDIKVLHSAVFKLPKLRILNLYGNHIVKFPKQAMESRLQKIIVGNNPIIDTELERLEEKFDIVFYGDYSVSPQESIEKEPVKFLPQKELKEEQKEKKKHQIFISYSHKDEKWLIRVKTHLKSLGIYYDIDEWDDQKLRPSDKWEEEITKALNNATIAILLFSADFMASDFINRRELQPLLEKASHNGVKIIPIMVSPCAMLKESGLGKYQGTNDPKKTLLEMSDGEVERTLADFVEKIKPFFFERKK